MKHLKLTAILISALIILALSGCKNNDDAVNIASTPLPIQTSSVVVSSTINPIVTASPFNPLYAFYAEYNAFSAQKNNELLYSYEQNSSKDLLALCEHMQAITLPMHTIGLLISSTNEDYYGSLSGGFAGSGEMLTYDNRYEFSYDFDNSEHLWGTFQDDVLTFYMGVSGSEDYIKMTLTKNNDGYISTHRTQNGITTLTITHDTISFE